MQTFMKKLSLSLPLATSTLVPGVSRPGWVGSDCKTDGALHSTSINCCSLTHWEITSPPCLLPWLAVVVSRYRPFPGSAAYCCQQVCHALLASPASTATCPVMSPQPAPCTGTDNAGNSVFRVLQPPVPYIYSIYCVSTV